MAKCQERRAQHSETFTSKVRKCGIVIYTSASGRDKYWAQGLDYDRSQWLRSLKADSHIARRAHAAPITFPCHAVPLMVYNVSFPFDLQSAVVSDSHLPYHAHAMLWTCCSSQGHGTARPSRDGLWATCPLSVSSGYHAEFHEDCYQKHINLRCRWSVWNQTTFVMDEEQSGSSTLQKIRSVKLLD